MSNRITLRHIALLFCSLVGRADSTLPSFQNSTTIYDSGSGSGEDDDFNSTPPATTNVTVSATRTECSCGNTIEENATFRPVDSEAPAITAVTSNVQIECDLTTNVRSRQQFVDGHGGAVASDSCGTPFEWTIVDAFSPSFSCPLTTMYTFMATDSCGNAASTTALYSVVDTTPPFFSKPAQTETRECSSEDANAAAMRNYIAVAGGAVAEDDCRWAEGTEGDPAVLRWDYPEVPANVNLQQCTQTVTFAFGVFDTCGLFARTMGNVIFVDSTAPVITKQPAAETKVAREAYSASTLRDWINSHGGSEAEDACDHGIKWSYDGDILPDLTIISGCTSEIELVFSVTDDCGNTAYTLPARFIVEDSASPQVNGVVDRTVECASNGNFEDARNFFEKTGTCTDGGDSHPTRSATKPSNGWTVAGLDGCADKQYNVSFRCTDGCGFEASEAASLYVTDTQPPLLSTKTATSFVYYCDGRCASTYWYEAANARYLFEKWLDDAHGCLGGFDECNAVDWEYTVTHDDGSMLDLNTLCGTSGSVAFTATDACGNAEVGTLKYSFPEIPQVESDRDASVHLPGTIFAPTIREPASCNRKVDLVNVCIPGTKPYDFATVSATTNEDVILFNGDATAGCCFDQRLSLISRVVISEGHVDTTLGKCDAANHLNRQFVPKVSCSALGVAQDVNATTAGCCFVSTRTVPAGKYVHNGHVESLAKDCSVSSTEMPSMVGFVPMTCQETRAAHDFVANHGCDANVCTAIEAATDGIVALKLQYVQSTPQVFAHSQTWTNRKEGVYSAAPYSTYIKISGLQRVVLYSGTVTNFEIFEINSDATGTKTIGGQKIHIQLGIGNDKVAMNIGIDCKKGRVLKIGDVWGVLKIVGYTLKSGARCTPGTSSHLHEGGNGRGGFVVPAAKALVVSEEAAVKAATENLDAVSTSKSPTPSLPVLGGIIGACIVLVLVIMGVVAVANKRPPDVGFNMESFNIDPNEQMIRHHHHHQYESEGNGKNVFPEHAFHVNDYDGSSNAGESVSNPVEHMCVVGAERTRWMQSLPADCRDVEEDENGFYLDTDMYGGGGGGVSRLVHHNTVPAPEITLDVAVAMSKSKLTARAISAPSRMESEFI